MTTIRYRGNDSDYCYVCCGLSVCHTRASGKDSKTHVIPTYVGGTKSPI